MKFMLGRRQYVLLMKALSQNLAEQSAVIASLYQSPVKAKAKPVVQAAANEAIESTEDQPGAARVRHVVLCLYQG